MRPSRRTWLIASVLAIVGVVGAGYAWRSHAHSQRAAARSVLIGCEPHRFDEDCLEVVASGRVHLFSTLTVMRELGAGPIEAVGVDVGMVGRGSLETKLTYAIGPVRSIRVMEIADGWNDTAEATIERHLGELSGLSGCPTWLVPHGAVELCPPPGAFVRWQIGDPEAAAALLPVWRALAAQALGGG